MAAKINSTVKLTLAATDAVLRDVLDVPGEGRSMCHT